MGFTPREVDAMSFPEFDACLTAFNRFHGGKKGASSISDADFEEGESLLDEVERRNAARMISNGN